MEAFYYSNMIVTTRVGVSVSFLPMLWNIPLVWEADSGHVTGSPAPGLAHRCPRGSLEGREMEWQHRLCSSLTLWVSLLFLLCLRDLP